jgi:hypothetical protein
MEWLAVLAVVQFICYLHLWWCKNYVERQVQALQRLHRACPLCREEMAAALPKGGTGTERPNRKPPAGHAEVYPAATTYSPPFDEVKHLLSDKPLRRPKR